jgi:putative transposase
MARRCELLGLARSSFYYEPVPVDPEELRIMHAIDEQYTRTPIYGVPRMVVTLKGAGFEVGPKRVRRLMRQMDLRAIYPQPRLSQNGLDHRKYPYLLQNLTIDRPGQVWCADITYIRMVEGFLYLVAILDWFSRYIVAWELSNTLDVGFCREALARAWAVGTPEIFNTDQGVQFTSRDFTGDLEARGVRVSMDGRGRVFDNIFIERFWRSLKYEDIYLHDYATGTDARRGIGRYMAFYNRQRPHQALGYATPHAVHFGRRAIPA